MNILITIVWPLLHEIEVKPVVGTVVVPPLLIVNTGVKDVNVVLPSSA